MASLPRTGETMAQPTAEPSAAPWPKLAVIGMVAGAMSGLFGIGGGFVIVPALTAWCGRGQRQAVATSLMAIFPLAIGGVIAYAAHGQLDVWAAVPLAIGSLVGAWFAAALLNHVPQRALRWIFAVVVLLTAAKLLLDPGAPTGPVSHDLPKLALLLPVGVLIGVLAGLTGTGGGAIMVPVMQLGFGIPAVVAKGTSLLVMLPSSVLGGWRNLRNGNGSAREAAWIGLSGVLATLATTQWSVVMNPTLSDILFAALLIVVVTRTIWGDLKALLART
jgi:uncharacterized membrane protein YfcA